MAHHLRPEMPVASAMMDRAAPRIRTLLRAVIEFNGRAATVECTVRDLSDTGARLDVSDSTSLPPNFDLFVPKHGRRYPCQMRWRHDGFVGVVFEPKLASAASPASGDRVAKLEAEVTRFRKLFEAIRVDPSQARLLLERFDLGPPGD